MRETIILYVECKNGQIQPEILSRNGNKKIKLLEKYLKLLSCDSILYVEIVLVPKRKSSPIGDNGGKFGEGQYTRVMYIDRERLSVKRKNHSLNKYLKTMESSVEKQFFLSFHVIQASPIRSSTQPEISRKEKHKK